MLILYKVHLMALIVIVVAIIGRVGAHEPFLDHAQLLTSVALRREVGRALDIRGQRRLVQGQRSLEPTDESMPIYHMLGSYFAYLWVGSPPQRVSVIMDTGSHYTAFPCTGCNCGTHMDPYFNPKVSSSSVVSKCFAGSRCYIKQSYSEGSSWHAYKVQDMVWVGDVGRLVSAPGGATNKKIYVPSKKMLQMAGNVSTRFEFGCQDRESGLFRTQQIDGIMGLSAEPDTLPYVLERNGITSTRAFSLCLNKHAGVLSFGGVDGRLLKPVPPENEVQIQFAKLLQGSGWYTVRLIDILMKNPETGEMRSLGVNSSKYNGGRGVIIDSGTTDTYLPADVTEKWNSLFARMTNGVKYSTRQREMTDREVDTMPTIVYRLEAPGSASPIDVESPAKAYTEQIELKNGQEKRAFRIYTTEKDGAVLGSNFMVGHNVFFDIERRRLGFSPSDCHYEDEFVDSKLAQMNAQGDSGASEYESSEGISRYIHLLDKELYKHRLDNLSTACGERSSFLSKGCNAMCDTAITTSYIAEGVQEWGQRLCTAGVAESTVTYTTKKCHVVCEDHAGGVVLGKSPGCRVHHWSSCSPSCEQQRYAPAYLNPRAQSGNTRSWLSSVSHWIVGISSGSSRRSNGGSDDDNGQCKPVLSKRPCQVHMCPIEKGDHAVTLVFSIVTIPLNVWTHAHRSEMMVALSRALDVPEHVIHTESPRQSPESLDSLEMQARIRISENLFSDSPKEVGDQIASISSHEGFPNLLAHYLNGEMLSDSWHWLTGNDMLSVKKVEVKRLTETGSKIKRGKRGADVIVADPGAEASGMQKAKSKRERAEQARIKAIKNSPSYFSINYSAFGSPFTWDKSTFLKILLITMIQAVSLSIFFVLRRMRAIQQAQSRDPTPTFDAFKGIAPKKRVSSRAGQALDRRGRNSSSRLHSM